MRHKYIYIVTILITLLASCGGAGKKHRRSGNLLTPASSGNPYEVMVVADDSVWTGYAGRAVQTILDRSLVGLPQAEEMFHKSHITFDHWDRITHLFRNVIVIKIGNEYSQPKIKVSRDEFSCPQLIMTIQGPNQVEVSQYITENTGKIANEFTSEEINREANDLVYDHNIAFAEKVREMFGCELYIPVDINKMKVGEDFIWASNDAPSSIQNIVIYSLPYVSEKMLTRDPYIRLRNKVMKDGIPGDKPDQYMSTNSEFVFVKGLNVRGDYVFEARGLWEMTNIAMGGPFVSHSRIDTVNNRVITVEGFVYAPDKMKRTMIRRVEAALYTLELPKRENEQSK